jgi:hypothetical protein
MQVNNSAPPFLENLSVYASLPNSISSLAFRLESETA